MFTISKIRWEVLPLITDYRARSIRTLALLVAGAAFAEAATFNYSVSCAQVTIGPSTIMAYNGSPGSVVLSPNLSLVTTLLPINATTRVDNNAAGPGTFPGTLSCNLTFAGVVTPFTR